MRFVSLFAAIALADLIRPVTKVVNLLEEMRRTLEKEHETDQELYEKLECWCKTNKKEKTAAIAAAQRRIENLNAFIEETAAKSGVLAAAIKNLEAEIAKNQNSYAAAQQLRLKEQQAFQGEEKDMLETIDALEKAIAAIGKVHGEGDAEEKASKTALVQVHEILAPFKSVLQKDLWDFLGEEQQATLRRAPKESMEQVIGEVFDKSGPRKNLLQQKVIAPSGAVAANSYNSRSGEIFGILKQMKDTFTNSLTDAQKQELVAKKRFKQLEAALTKEINAATEAKNDKTLQLAETNQKNAQAKADIRDTKAALSADEQFQLELEERCSTEDAAFAERQKTRAAEIQAVGETIGFLTDDDARDLFSRTLNFVQISSSHEKQRRKSALSLMMQIAKKTNNYSLAGLAVTLKLDGFGRVKKAMDDMVAHLKQEQKDEYQHREWCNKELDTTEDSLADKSRLRDDLVSTSEDLQNTIATLTEDTKTLNGEIAEMQTQLKRAGEDRAKENKEFQSTVADQRAMVQVLKKAVSRLQKFYNSPLAAPAKTSLLQNTPGRAVDNKAPVQQATYSKNGASSGAIGLIQEIIADAQRLEADALHAEQESQKDYETIVKSTNQSVRANQDQIANKAVAKSQAEVDSANTKQELNGTLNVLEKLTQYNANVHKSCDFVVKNFDVSQTARQEEIESIQQAKAILSGSNFDG